VGLIALPVRSPPVAARDLDRKTRRIAEGARAARPERRGTAWWVEAQGQVWLVRRPGKGLLGGMMALPGSDWRTDGDDTAPPLPGAWRRLGMVRHVFTHFSLGLEVAALRLPVMAGLADALGAGQWWRIDRLSEAGLPTLFAKAAALARDESGRAAG
jgi:A/G-specific adenine glycosylase